MPKKFVFLLEIIAIILASFYYILIEVIPDYKKNIGSSDKFINLENYENMLEFEITNKINFAVIINKNKSIYQIIFLDENASCLYNKNIENNDLESSLEMIIKILIENNYLDNSSIFKIIRYNDLYYQEFISSLNKILIKFNINNSIEIKKDLKEKAKELSISSEDDREILKYIDYYSKELTRTFKKQEKILEKKLDKTTSQEYINNVYKKIEKYINDNKIENLNKNNSDLIITLIPADNNGKYYPSNNSWYYVENKKVYAYIEIVENNQKYSYCFNGAIDFNKEGECK